MKFCQIEKCVASELRAWDDDDDDNIVPSSANSTSCCLDSASIFFALLTTRAAHCHPCPALCTAGWHSRIEANKEAICFMSVIVPSFFTPHNYREHFLPDRLCSNYWIIVIIIDDFHLVYNCCLCTVSLWINMFYKKILWFWSPLQHTLTCLLVETYR